MADIQISITDKRPQVIGAPVIVCGNSDYTLTFSFDAGWDAVGAKTARFVYIRDGAVMYEDVVFTGSTVAVPILTNIREVRVGVYSGNLHTSTPAVIPCECSIRCGTGAPADPTPSQYDQIVKLLQANAAAVSGIKIGGRNITTGTQAPTVGTGGRAKGHWRKSGTGDMTVVDISDPPSPGLTKCIRLRSGSSAQVGMTQDGCLLQQGEPYTFSCWVRASTEGTAARLQPFIGSGTMNFEATTAWRRIIYTAPNTPTATQEYSAAFVLLAAGAAAGAFLEVCGVQLERGNTATDWAPAPEDAQIRIAALEDRVATLEAALLSAGGEG